MNNDQPHLVVHKSEEHQGQQTKRSTTICYLTVYSISRHFGGPEEGGWWYDTHHHESVDIPFYVEQDYVVQVLDAETEFATDERDFLQCWRDEDSKEIKAWVPVGLPYVVTEETRAFLQRAREHLASVYGPFDTGHRFSSAQRGTDYVMRYELFPGVLERTTAPRYE